MVDQWREKLRDSLGSISMDALEKNLFERQIDGREA